MSVNIRCVVILGALLLVTGNAASAQYPQARRGFWFGFGLGYGSGNSTCDNCLSGPRVSSNTAWIKAGGTLNPRVRLGGLIDGWSNSSGGTTETMANLTASVYLYPRPATGFFVTGGLGFSNYRVDTSPAITGTGWGLTVGVGYDVRVGREVSLTPAASYGYGSVGDIVVGAGGGTYATGWTQNFLDFGLGITFH